MGQWSRLRWAMLNRHFLDTKLCRALSLQGIVRGASDYQIGKLSAAVRDYGAGMLPTFWDAAVALVWSVRGNPRCILRRAAQDRSNSQDDLPPSSPRSIERSARASSKANL